MNLRPHSAFKAFLLLMVVIFAAASVAPAPAQQRVSPATIRLRGHIPTAAIQAATWSGRLASGATIAMAIALPLRNQAELQDLLARLYDPSDPLYGQYLTPEEFVSRFGPTQDDYDLLASYVQIRGLTVIGTHSNRLLLDVSGSAQSVEAVFNLRMQRYRAQSGREFYAPDNEPEVPEFIASRILGIIGLDNAAVRHAYSHFSSAQEGAVAPLQIGTGPGGALTPSDIVAAYNLSGSAANGSGQTLGVFELDGYTASDISTYENYYALPAVPLQNVLVDRVSGRPGSGATEVTLDIELQVAMAPGASRIMVYEGPNTDPGILDTYNKIVTDNQAKQISTCWGLSETQSSSAIMNSENSVFQQMAAQGQSIFAASGDSGAYDNGSTLSVDDPASQPFMTGTGGTQLFVNSGETYNHETAWNNGSQSGGAGGGGISAVWSIPSYQQGLISASSKGSTTMRNVPDVSINADQYTGYSIYYGGGWWIFGGTSCSAPLWAAFTARVNQQRLANGMSVLGFANPPLYQIGTGTNYSLDFHDIADGNTNLYYASVAGFDDATGWGSFNGANLLADLSGPPQPLKPPAAPQNLTASAGNAAVTLSWSASAGATGYSIYRGTSSGGEGSAAFKTGITATSFTDSGLTNGTTYYYRITAGNSAGTSGFSNEASATPSAPVLQITSGPTASAGSNSARIQWTTNLGSNSVVHYGISSGNLNLTVSSNALVTSHSLTLSGLSRRTRYYYQVSSTAGTTVSSGILSFSTSSGSN